METTPVSPSIRLGEWMRNQCIFCWGVADLRGFVTPPDEMGRSFASAIAFVIPVNPAIMAELPGGPTPAYAEEYRRINVHIDEIGHALAEAIKSGGYPALALAASARTSEVEIRGDFPHKTAATRAGLGWIGRHCQLITHNYGSWVRLGTVFTSMDLPCGPPAERNFCGKCSKCVDACPAKALTGKAWQPGMPREEILDARKCDDWKKEHYPQYRGHLCGICSAVCPHSIKSGKKGLDHGNK
ncbi:MAG: 4Fe-4S double cluster binding domain-containing protein [Syntrophobacter sp.]